MGNSQLMGWGGKIKSPKKGGTLFTIPNPRMAARAIHCTDVREQYSAGPADPSCSDKLRTLI